MGAFYLLVTGSPLLTVALDRNNTLPLGTPITALGLVCLPLTILWSSKKIRVPQNLFYKILRWGLVFSITLACLWIPISYSLAGNLSFSFSEKTTFQGGQEAMRWFWRISYFAALLPLLILIAHLLHHFTS